MTPKLENIVYIERAGTEYFVKFDSYEEQEKQIALPVYTEAQNISRVFKSVVKTTVRNRVQVKNEICENRAKALINSLLQLGYLVNKVIYTTEPEDKNFWKFETNIYRRNMKEY